MSEAPRSAGSRELAVSALGEATVDGFLAGVAALPDRGGAAVRSVEQSLAAVADGARLNAFATVTGEEARARAALLDAQAAAGRAGRLHGRTLAVKDCLDVAGVAATCGALARRDALARSTAPAVATLEQAGAVVVGTTTMHEWAFGATSSSPLHGQVVNPHGPGLLPGGSSGGSAVAVAAGMADLALGTDTGGSIRLPASWCGIAGLKVSPGAVPTDGCFPLSPTMDTVGPLARTVHELEPAVRALLAAAARHPGRPLPRLADARIGLLRGTLEPGRLDPHVVRGVGEALARLGVDPDPRAEIELPGAQHVFAAQMAIVCSEASAVHGGPRRADRATYGRDVQGLLALGELVSPDQVARAQALRLALAREAEEVFERVDVLLSPTTPMPAPPISGPAEVVWPDGTREGLLAAAIRFLLPVNFLGLTALSIPCPVPGLPVGLQLIGPCGSDLALTRLGVEIERALLTT